MRELLVETAARLIATDGLAGLTLRRLTREVGTSTMAIYTHFGSMDELRHAIRREGFARMGARFRELDPSDDPVADLVRQGRAYWRNAVDNPNLYRAMFMHGSIDDPQAGVGESTFDLLVEAVQRCLDAGRFETADPRALAVRMWSMVPRHREPVSQRTAHRAGVDRGAQRQRRRAPGLVRGLARRDSQIARRGRHIMT